MYLKWVRNWCDPLLPCLFCVPQLKSAPRAEQQHGRRSSSTFNPPTSISGYGNPIALHSVDEYTQYRNVFPTSSEDFRSAEDHQCPQSSEDVEIIKKQVNYHETAPYHRHNTHTGAKNTTTTSSAASTPKNSPTGTGMYDFLAYFRTVGDPPAEAKPVSQSRTGGATMLRTGNNDDDILGCGVNVGSRFGSGCDGTLSLPIKSLPSVVINRVEFVSEQREAVSLLDIVNGIGVDRDNVHCGTQQDGTGSSTTGRTDDAGTASTGNVPIVLHAFGSRDASVPKDVANNAKFLTFDEFSKVQIQLQRQNRGASENAGSQTSADSQATTTATTDAARADGTDRSVTIATGDNGESEDEGSSRVAEPGEHFVRTRTRAKTEGSISKKLAAYTECSAVAVCEGDEAMHRTTHSIDGRRRMRKTSLGSGLSVVATMPSLFSHHPSM